ncbi:hypothetical protein BDA96_09G179000 [Sorghum bicolor]|uniref:Knottin scorpion toxin-like domain-containing protein n=2 Tax=Sorghum bicolor TaxID=4558 RepID=A0A921QDT3_SORBI|nr:hypothetical protein BDA96_09G179000 [Sorghum bicolor]KXG22193.1 hypothetical protein SORBI_3009G169500 [Sorghum bicolor]
MEMTSKAMASGLLVLMLLMNIGFVLPVRADCWSETSDVCTKTHNCRSNCQGRGQADGKCKWEFPDLVPFCYCLRPNCNP